MNRVSKIIFEMSPYYQPHQIELYCQMTIDGEKVSWKEIFPDDDFESRAEKYLDYMKRKIIDAITSKEVKDKIKAKA